jgi:hypothetical protein
MNGVHSVTFVHKCTVLFHFELLIERKKDLMDTYRMAQLPPVSAALGSRHLYWP